MNTYQANRYIQFITSHPSAVLSRLSVSSYRGWGWIRGIIILVGSFYTLASGDFRRLRILILVSIGIGLGILLSYCAGFYVGIKAPIHSVKFGLWGTILGFIVAAVGMFLTTRKNRAGKTTRPSHRI